MSKVHLSGMLTLALCIMSCSIDVLIANHLGGKYKQEKFMNRHRKEKTRFVNPALICVRIWYSVLGGVEFSQTDCDVPRKTLSSLESWQRCRAERQCSASQREGRPNTENISAITVSFTPPYQPHWHLVLLK